MSSQFSWLDHLNAVDTPPKTEGNDAGTLSEDLRSQLEAWTTVAFGDDAFNGVPGSFHSSDRDESAGSKNGELDSKDPSPYAKRPFGQFNHNYGLERGFNAFNPSNFDNSGSSSFNDIYAGLGFGNIDSTTAADGSNALFAAPVTLDEASLSVPVAFQQLQPKSRNIESGSTGSDNVDGVPAPKKQKLSASPTSSTPSTPSFASPAISSTNTGVPVVGTSTMHQTVRTKAALLAAQAAELAPKKAVTPEEEAARQAELNRIAAEDDKRRRNTAASARFRVKKKQREAALEDTVKGLNDRIEKLEKDLEASKAENNFLRDLVIRKVGLSDLPGSAGGRISGGQEGSTGMGTGLAF